MAGSALAYGSGFALRLAALLVWLATVTVSMARAAEAQPPSPEKLERITEFFDNEVAAGRLPGAVILIQQHGRVVYLNCFGVRDVATGAPMTPDTIFALHSMTKPITSLAAMMLIDSGRLALDDPVSRYIPSFAQTKVGVDTLAADGSHFLTRVPRAWRPSAGIRSHWAQPARSCESARAAGL